MPLQQQGAFFWPEHDTITPGVVLNEVRRLPLYLAHVEPARRQVCVQAGGNVGVYATALAAEFRRVITVEPDPQNWECLCLNVPPGVEAHHACLGAVPQAGGWLTYRPAHETHNYGATCVCPGPAGVPMLTIDGWSLPQLDFLLLDIEGYEQAALEGAAETIARCRPTIAIELKGLGRPHGWPDAMTHEWLRAQRYQQAATIGRDFIYTPC